MGKKDYLCPELPNQEMLNVHIATMCEPLVLQRSKVCFFFKKKLAYYMADTPSLFSEENVIYCKHACSYVKEKKRNELCTHKRVF